MLGNEFSSLCRLPCCFLSESQVMLVCFSPGFPLASCSQIPHISSLFSLCYSVFPVQSHDLIKWIYMHMYHGSHRAGQTKFQVFSSFFQGQNFHFPGKFMAFIKAKLLWIIVNFFKFFVIKWPFSCIPSVLETCF